MKEYPYRISEAAIGKIYAELISLTRNAEIPAEQMHATMCAVFGYIESEREPAPDEGVDPSVWERFKARIDRSARLSASARARAARRRDTNTDLAPAPSAPAPESLAAGTPCRPAVESAPAPASTDRTILSHPEHKHPGREDGGHGKTHGNRPIKMVKVTSLRSSRRNRRRRP